MSRLSIIVAMARNRTIGRNNSLPWHCPEDLQRFKFLTTGHCLIMGHNTFDSIGRPLPGRTTVVLSRDPGLKIEGCLIAHSLPEALSLCSGDSEAFVIGGAQIYAQALEVADTLYLTEIQQDFDGDVYFPEFDTSLWLELSREVHSQEIPRPLDFHFVTYRRK
jgi:dihydrofolate reductase